jgi:hypothetical protein
MIDLGPYLVLRGISLLLMIIMKQIPKYVFTH